LKRVRKTSWIPKNNRKTTDFITIAKAKDLIIYHIGRIVSHSTVARWGAQNELGFKMDGIRGQWSVDAVFSGFSRTCIFIPWS
jgi:hypothetical protein